MKYIYFLIVCAQAAFRPAYKNYDPTNDQICKLKYELHDYDPNPNPHAVITAPDGKFRIQGSGDMKTLI